MIQAIGPEELFSEVVAYVEQAAALLERGEWVELVQLDARVQGLCEHIARLPKEQAQEYLPELEYLFASVAALEERMVKARDAVADDLRGAGNIERANRAYVKSDSLASQKKEP